jgi:hypothetical protein
MTLNPLTFRAKTDEFELFYVEIHSYSLKSEKCGVNPRFLN